MLDVRLDARRLLAAGAAVAAGVANAATTVTVVHPSDLGAHWHTADTRFPGTLDFSTQYGGAPGTGAAVLSTSTTGAKVQLLTDQYDGTPLSEITALSYWTYRVTAPTDGGPAVTALNMRVDFGDDDNPDAAAYLVYEPYWNEGNAAIHDGEWQQWDAWKGGDAKWYSNQIPSGDCSRNTPCTIDTFLQMHPHATLDTDDTSPGSLGFNQGSWNAGLVAAADGLHIATNTGVDVTYDFQPDVVLTDKEQCKDGRWATSTAPVFRNQGECVSRFASSTGQAARGNAPGQAGPSATVSQPAVASTGRVRAV